VIETCPVCKGDDIHHSRLRNWMERLRWRLTRRVPYRCHGCDWRGWREDGVLRRDADGMHRVLHRSITDDEIDHLDDGAPGSLT
jgi:hypothetical protein